MKLKVNRNQSPMSDWGKTNTCAPFFRTFNHGRRARCALPNGFRSRTNPRTNPAIAVNGER